MPKQDPGHLPFDPWQLALALQVVLILFLFYYNRYLALLMVAAVLSWGLYSKNTLTTERLTGSRTQLVGAEPEGIVRRALANFPVPLVLSSASGRVLLASTAFRELFPETERGRKLEAVAAELAALEDEPGATLTLSGRQYRVCSYSYKTAHERLAVFYLEDITHIGELERKLRDQAPVIGLLQIDNHDEVLTATPEGQRPLLIAAVDKYMTDWAQALHVYLHKYAEDRYTLFLTQAALSKCQEDKFSFLDRIKEISVGNSMPVTVSLGLGYGSQDPLELAEFAKTALDLALGRGGDQAVLKTPHDFHYYGGKTKAPEKRTKVKARVIAQALRELMAGADRVIAMGHQGADCDCLGAGVALAKAARDLGKPGYFVLTEITPAVAKLYTYLTEHESYRDVFIDATSSLRLATKDTLVIVLDTHKPSLVDVPRLLGRTRKIVIIDHHRRAEEFIPDPTLVYLESYASSTCELTAEIVQYMDKVKMTSLEATALLAGIAVDTKNFAFQTGVRTFEAAAYLRRSGADAQLVQSLFQNDLESLLRRAETLQTVRLLPGGLAVAEVADSGPNSQLMAAQVANELLNVEEIKASFVLYPYKDGTAVSARSLGGVNVQLLMEKLGGGGHLTIAGAQLPGLDVGAAQMKVSAILEEYLSEGDEA
ncbi:MAG: DHH family phosphoesterase [bacterium]